MVIVGIVVKGVPTVIGRVLALIRALVRESAEFVEINAVRPSMVEHAVKHHAHTVFSGFRTKFLYAFVAAELLVAAHIVRGVVAVIAGREKDGRQIKRGHAKSRKITKTGNYAFRIPAEEVVRTVVLSFPCNVGQLVPVRVQPALFAKPHLSRSCEAVGENLIHNAAFRPIGRFIRAFRHGQLPFRQPLPRHGTAAFASAVIGRPATRHALEAVIPQPRGGHGRRPLVHESVAVEARKAQVGAEFLRAPAEYDGHSVRLFGRRQRKPERRRLSRRRRPVRRLVA